MSMQTSTKSRGVMSSICVCRGLTLRAAASSCRPFPLGVRVAPLVRSSDSLLSVEILHGVSQGVESEETVGHDLQAVPFAEPHAARVGTVSVLLRPDVGGNTFRRPMCCTVPRTPRRFCPRSFRQGRGRSTRPASSLGASGSGLRCAARRASPPRCGPSRSPGRTSRSGRLRRASVATASASVDVKVMRVSTTPDG